MDLGLKAKVAAVAGASRGIGRAIATTLAREHATLSLCARDQEQLEDSADKICQVSQNNVYTIALDLNQADSATRFIDYTVKQAGKLDILITNTGGPPAGQFMNFNDDDWKNAGEQLLFSSMRLIRAAIPHMKKQGGGRIINITSISVKQPIAELILSTSYRAAIIGMAKTLAKELAADNILVNNICPGKISTDRLASLDQLTAERKAISIENVRMDAQRQIPLGRYGQPEEIASLVAFLASSQASYITGTTIQCDGGLYDGLM